MGTVVLHQVVQAVQVAQDFRLLKCTVINIVLYFGVGSSPGSPGPGGPGGPGFQAEVYSDYIVLYFGRAILSQLTDVTVLLL